MRLGAQKTNQNNNAPKLDDDDKVIYYANETFKAPEGKLTFSKGQELEVIEKSPNGWWFVRVGKEEGWVPSTIVQRHRGRTFVDEKDILEGQMYKALGGYKATDDTGISFEPGQLVEVLEKDAGGWWFVKIGNEEGWAPSTFLGEVSQSENTPPPITARSSSKAAPLPVPRKPSVQREVEEEGEAYITLSNYTDPDEGMLNFKKGQRVLVLEKDDGGWWMAKLGKESGWVPSNFLKKE